MPSPTDYESLGYDERMRRIGRLVLKAVTLAQLRREQACAVVADKTTAKPRSATPSMKLTPLEMSAEFVTEEELALLRRIARLREIAPREAARFWRSSRATTSRRLIRLEKAGWVNRHGSTTATRYQLTTLAQAFLRQVRQAVQVPSEPQVSDDRKPTAVA